MIEKRLEAIGQGQEAAKLKALKAKTEQQLEAEEDYKILLDNFNDGVDVREGETIKEYLDRKGFKGLSVEQMKKNRIKLASDYSDPSYVNINLLDPEVLQMMDEFKKAKENGYKGDLKQFSKEYFSGGKE